MTHRPFVMYPHKALRTKPSAVTEITDEVRAVWDEMIDAMDTMPGVGLAANQLGIDLALVVVDASEKRGQAIRLANPEVLHSSIEPREHEEASPNLPGVSAKVTRPRAVTVRYMNQDGVWDRKDFVGPAATSVQHQIDHLNGKMFIDHLSRTKRDMLIKRAAKLRG